MKKEFLLFVIVSLLMFIGGILIGTQLNDKGRYQTDNDRFGLTIFDTKTGVYYFKAVSEYGKIRYFKGDVKNATREEYEPKKSTK